MQRLFNSGVIQTKLIIGKPRNNYEQEAEKVVAEIMKMFEPDNSQDSDYESLSDREEDKNVQIRPIAEQITPFVQRQVESKEEVQKEELSHSKGSSSTVGEVTPTLESGIDSLRGGGQPLSASARSYFEPRFGTDFRRVRIHANSKTAKMAKSINARAFTIGKNIVFNTGQYSPETKEGKQLLAHELTHVVQQDKGNAKSRTNYISRWSAAEHGRITKKVLLDKNFKGKFNFWTKRMIAKYSGLMDTRVGNYLWYLSARTGNRAEWIRRGFEEAPNHGEANMYKWSIYTQRNIDRMNSYKQKAISLCNKTGFNDPSMIPLGNALHVAQDRGAHGEGLPKHGHDNPNIRADDPKSNSSGYRKALKLTKKVLDEFLAGLTKSKQRAAKSEMPRGKSVEGGGQINLGVAFTKGKQLVYISKGAYTIFPRWKIFHPLLKFTYAYYGGKRGHLGTANIEAGLRLLRLTPRIYIDLYTGGVVGYNFSDKKALAGLSSTLSGHYTGKRVDLGFKINAVTDFVRKHNIIAIALSLRL